MCFAVESEGSEECAGMLFFFTSTKCLQEETPGKVCVSALLTHFPRRLLLMSTLDVNSHDLINICIDRLLKP